MEHIVWHNRYERQWLRAFPLGNGRMGAMVYGDPHSELLQLNEESLWAGRKIQEQYVSSPEILQEIRSLVFQQRIDEACALCEKSLLAEPRMVRPYQTFGELHLDFAEKTPWENYKKSLCLEDGVVRVSYDKARNHYESRCFIAQSPDVMVYELTAQMPFDCQIWADRDRDAVSTKTQQGYLLMNGTVTYEQHDWMGQAGRGMSFGALIWVDTDGEKSWEDSVLHICQAKKITLYCAVKTNYSVEDSDIDENFDYVQWLLGQVEAARAMGAEAMENAHMQSHREKLSGSFLKLAGEEYSHLPTDERLERVRQGKSDAGIYSLYYQFGRYLLLSCSGQNAMLPANLQGIWNDSLTPPWSSDYHTNINLQMNYWPADLTGLPETVEPLFRYIQRLVPFGEETAKKLYFAQGWVMHHTSDIFGRTGIHDGVNWGMFPMAGPWMCLNLWEHYEFTADEAYLQELFPVLCGASRFVESFLVEGENGYLVTNPSSSPENYYRCIGPDGKEQVSMFTYGATVDFEIIYALLTRTVYACKHLNREHQLAQRLEAVLKRLPPLRVSQRYGTLCEWIKDYEETEPGHRHISHMFALYPSDQITAQNPQLFQAAKNTVARRLQNGSGSQGWSRAWTVNFYARLYDSGEFLRNLNHLIGSSTADNLLDIHPPFQIDGNFGGTAGIAEALLQSQLGEIGQRVLDILPALPQQWHTGEVRGLRARGGLTVDIQWEQGKVTRLCIRANAPTTVKIQWNERLDCLAIGENRLENGVLTVCVEAGRTYCLQK